MGLLDVRSSPCLDSFLDNMGTLIPKHKINKVAITGTWLVLLLALCACRLLLVTLDHEVHMSARISSVEPS